MTFTLDWSNEQAKVLLLINDESEMAYNTDFARILRKISEPLNQVKSWVPTMVSELGYLKLLPRNWRFKSSRLGSVRYMDAINLDGEGKMF